MTQKTQVVFRVLKRVSSANYYQLSLPKTPNGRRSGTSPVAGCTHPRPVAGLLSLDLVGVRAQGLPEPQNSNPTVPILKLF